MRFFLYIGHEKEKGGAKLSERARQPQGCLLAIDNSGLRRRRLARRATPYLGLLYSLSSHS